MQQEQKNVDELSLKLESSKISNHNHTNTNTDTNCKTSEDLDIMENDNHNSEEKESSNDLGELSYCRGMSKTPLAVPMVADTQTQSVTRNDAKAITNSRLKRLKELSQRPEAQLSKDQQNEKKRIIRLEKNRRAAAMSRRKKKMYVKNLEDKYNLMARHLQLLEMENGHLRALLSASHTHHNIAALPPIANMQPMTAFNKIPHFPQRSKVTNFTASSNIDNSISETPNISTNVNSSSANRATHHSIEPNMDNVEPSLKRRRLNDGSSANTTSSPSCDNTPDDISILEPLPISGVHMNNNNNNNNNNNRIIAPLPPGVPVNFMPQNHMMPPSMHLPSRLMPPSAYGQPHIMRNMMHHHHHHPQIPMMQSTSYDSMIKRMSIDDNGNESDDKTRESASVEIQERNNHNNHNNNHHNNIPPDIQVPELPSEYLSILDDDIIEETVDEYGSINDVIYL